MRIGRRQAFLLLGVVGVALVTATVLTLRGGGTAAPDAVLGHLGPTPGPDSSGYVGSKRAYLARIAAADPEATTAALVSLAAYAPAPGVQEIAAGMEPVAVWVRFPGAEAQVVLVETTVAGAVADAAAELRADLEADIEELRSQLGAADEAQRASLEAVIATTEADLARVTAGCGCVFAFSVEGAGLGELQRLYERDDVRLVDVPDPLAADLSGWELQPLVPREQRPSPAPG